MQAIKDKIISIRKLPNKKTNVYDLEVEDNHNFVANNIFVHNTDSIHVMLKAETLEGAVELGKMMVSKINKSFNEFVKPYGLEKNKYLKVKLEAIASSSFYKAKKRYAMKIVWDGEILKEPEYKVVGLEPRRSDNPELTGKITMRVLTKILNNKSEENIKNYVEKVIKRMESGKYKLYDIAIPKGIQNPLRVYFNGKCRIDKKRGTGCGKIYPGALPFSEKQQYENKIEFCEECGKKITYTKPIHAFAADFSNTYLKTNFKLGDKVRCLYVSSTGKYPETHVIAIDEDVTVPKDITINMDKQLDKVIIEKVEPLLEAIGIDLGISKKKEKKSRKKIHSTGKRNKFKTSISNESGRLLADFSNDLNKKKSKQLILGG